MRIVHWLDLALLSAALLLPAGPGRAGSPEEAAMEVLADRAESACDQALGVWLDSEAGVQEPAVRRAVAQCYEALAQLHTLGRHQPLIAEGTRLRELPARWLAQKADIRLDPYRPLAGKVLAVPEEERP